MSFILTPKSWIITCGKCWENAQRDVILGLTSDSIIKAYYKLLQKCLNKPCYLDCPSKHEQHYSPNGCPDCKELFFQLMQEMDQHLFVEKISILPKE